MNEQDDFILLNKTNFVEEVIKSKKPVLVEASATWCGASYILELIVDELVDTFREKIKFAKLNYDKYASLAEKYSFRPGPGLLLFKSGKLVEQFEEVIPRNELEKILNQVIHSRE